MPFQTGEWDGSTNSKPCRRVPTGLVIGLSIGRDAQSFAFQHMVPVPGKAGTPIRSVRAWSSDYQSSNVTNPARRKGWKTLTVFHNTQSTGKQGIAKREPQRQPACGPPVQAETGNLPQPQARQRHPMIIIARPTSPLSRSQIPEV